MYVYLFLQSKFRKQGKKEETAETYFLAGRSMLWWAVSISPTLLCIQISVYNDKIYDHIL